MIKAMTIEPNASKPTNLSTCTYASNEGIDKNNTYATVPRIMNHHMVLDTLLYPPRSSITALQTSFRIAIFTGSCILPIPSFVFSAELFPFSPPTSQQRSVDQTPQVRPQLSKEDLNRISRLADQAKKLTPDEQRQLRESIQRKQKEAVRQANLNQAQYYTELLTQIGQESR
jgi:hypothetical protein